MTARPIFRHLDVPVDEPAGAAFAFEMQPIVQLADGRVKAYEMLYRGPRPADWAKVDSAVLSFLGTHRPGLQPLYVNLSNDALMAHSADAFQAIVSANDVTFELSEAVSGYSDRAVIAEKVNELISVGARMALDDFGAGRDGLERLYAIRNAAVVKIDREFLLTCMQRQDARRILVLLVAEWRREGVKSIAEGVETAEMFTFAQAMNVDLVQGWWVDDLVGRNLLGESE
jgi:EAL domain-containing protein (putative c-di-GMP-specific phosphodiesterase class I)